MGARVRARHRLALVRGARVEERSSQATFSHEAERNYSQKSGAFRLIRSSKLDEKRLNLSEHGRNTCVCIRRLFPVRAQLISYSVSHGDVFCTAPHADLGRSPRDARYQMIARELMTAELCVPIAGQRVRRVDLSTPSAARRRAGEGRSGNTGSTARPLQD